jgi:hypothetical protein
MTTDALKSWQDAMCTAAALESEKETELRLRASIQAAQHPDIAILSAIEGMVLPKCPACQRFLPAFDGISNQALTTNEFSIHQVCTMLFANCTEGWIAYVFHGRKQQRECW